MFNPKLYFKDNVHLIKQGNAELASSVLATINGNITLPARGKCIITNYKNAVSFSFKDDDFPPLPFPALPKHYSVGNNLGNLASNIMKPVHTKRFDVRRWTGTSKVCNTVVCVCNVNVGYNRSALASLIIISTSMINMLVFRLVLDLAAILVFITLQTV